MSLYDVMGFMTFLVACAAAAAPGMRFTPGDWYARLDKPRWTPPDRVFAPVWTVLYFLIAVSGWLFWSAGAESDRRDEARSLLPLVLFMVQLALNALWPVLFFGLRLPGYAFAGILLLWCAILATILLFAPLQPVAAWLLVPYLLWVTFAAALNFSIWRRSLARRVQRPPGGWNL
jgi:tryptophan-rich sensory protein